ncbi:MAG: MFS transporter [Liquorilactobacillus hordei]|uniref:MFS transporter n=2 Tax=Liquorilactobacillus hordei TaxID=468911 RepID=A0A3Q8CAV2_9LACO|nr:MFS transporter [Liquorilactobacillus hordei]AUJ28878.1 MFS transporter [Liquorilactobacillus hordei]MBZ2406275.1 MFS transporter [Liquorilactobacillus hordei]
MDIETRNKNFRFAWLGTFMAGMAFSEAIPFLSLYIAQLGNFTEAQVGLYTGLSYAASYIVVIIVSPFWGKIADKYGRKPMLIRTSFGMAIVISLIGCATSVWQIIILRMFQGFFDGYSPSAIALISAETPQKQKTRIIATLSTGYILGGLLGPIFGGLLGTIFSYRIIFLLTGFILLCVGIISLLGIKEDFIKQVKQKHQKKESLLSIMTFNIILLLSVTMLLQLIESLITPFISLVISKMISDQSYLSLAAGIISALPGLATALSATPLSNLSTRHGEIKVMLIADAILLTLYLFLGLTNSLLIFGILRLLGGFCSGALFPMTQVLLSKSTDKISTIFSLGLSAQSIGSLFGSVMGSTIIQFVPLKNLFLIAAVVLLINLIILYSYNKKNAS